MFTDVAEELTDSIVNVKSKVTSKKQTELGAYLLLVVCFAYLTLTMESEGSSETSVNFVLTTHGVESQKILLFTVISVKT
jgi:hypothetical protein